VVGTCGYPAIVASADRGSLGYELARRAWGHGFATEAVGAIVDFGHRTMRLHRIDALVVSGNDASAAVLRKCGFRREAVLSDYGLFQGRYHDMEMFAVSINTLLTRCHDRPFDAAGCW
jgi:ribosomal-protein-alanine N-acetyltransferase